MNTPGDSILDFKTDKQSKMIISGLFHISANTF